MLHRDFLKLRISLSYEFLETQANILELLEFFKNFLRLDFAFIMFIIVFTMNISPSSFHRHSSGLSLVEVLLTVALISVIAAIGAVTVTGVTRNTQHRKLEADVQALNSAITLYQASGGSLDGHGDANAVLAKLKTTRSKAERARHAGAPSGRLIDPRIAAVAVPDSSWKLRARYDTAAKRFVSESSGNGIEFVLDDSLAEVAATLEDRDAGAVSYAATSTWVWDHASTATPNAPGGPSKFSTNPGVTDSSPGDPEPEPEPEDPGPPAPPPPPPPPRLSTPTFDLAGGAHPENSFPLTVSITNLPAPDQGSPLYRLGGGAWTPYTGPVTVPMNTQLSAVFRTLAPEDWRDSSERSATYYPVPESLSGTTGSNFHSPSGGANLKYKITDGGHRFEHGDPVFILDGEPIHSGDPNVLSFTSRPFSNVAPGQQFKLGDFYYHNGSTYYDSHATGVKLRITIDLPERGQTVSFDLILNLVNTENDPDDADASADYVKITNLSQNIPLQINGVNYKIALQFGATDSYGFSNGSQFHVYEGATGQGELLGTFLPR